MNYTLYLSSLLQYINAIVTNYYNSGRHPIYWLAQSTFSQLSHELVSVTTQLVGITILNSDTHQLVDELTKISCTNQ